MNEMDKKLFLGWLEEEEKKKQKELEPFYKLRERRDEAGMNSYGCGTPHDYVLLEEVYAIYCLKTKIENGTDIMQLIIELEQKDDKQKDDNNRKVELRIIRKYQESFVPPRKARR